MCRGQCNAFFRQKKIVDKQECQYRRELEFPYSKLHVGKVSMNRQLLKFSESGMLPFFQF